MASWKYCSCGEDLAQCFMFRSVCCRAHPAAAARAAGPRVELSYSAVCRRDRSSLSSSSPTDSKAVIKCALDAGCHCNRHKSARAGSPRLWHLRRGQPSDARRPTGKYSRRGPKTDFRRGSASSGAAPSGAEATTRAGSSVEGQTKLPAAAGAAISSGCCLLRCLPWCAP